MTKTKDTKYLPFDDLEQFVKERLRSCDVEHLPDIAIAKEIDVDTTTVNRWRHAGKLTWLAADTAAVKLGEHPISIWPVAWIALDDGIYQGDISKALAKKLDWGLERIGEVLNASRAIVEVYGPYGPASC